MITEPLEVKFLGNDLIQVDGVKMSLAVIKSAMNPSVHAQRTLFSVKREGDQLEFTSYFNAQETVRFFESL